MSTDNFFELVFEPLAVDIETAEQMLGLSPSAFPAYMRTATLISRYLGTNPDLRLKILALFWPHHHRIDTATTHGG